MSNISKGYILIMMTAFFYSIQAIFTKFAYGFDVNVTTTLVIRFAICILVFLIYLLFKPMSLKIPTQALGSTFFLISIHIVLDICLFLALVYLPASLTMILVYLYPALVALFGFLFFKQSLNGLKVLALFLTLGGTVLLLWQGQLVLNGLGVTLALLTALGYAVYILFLPKALTKIPHLVFMWWMFVISFLVYGIFGLWTSQLELNFVAVAWLPLLGVGLFSTFGSMVTMLYGVSLLGSFKSSLVLTSEIPLGVLWAFIFLGESFTGIQCLGAVFVFAALILLELKN